MNSARGSVFSGRLCTYVGALAIVMLGLYLRLDSIAASLWLDEFGTFWVVEGDFYTLLDRCWNFQGQSPLYYTLPWLSLQVLGESEIALRLPSLLLGCALALVLYASGRTAAGNGGGWLAATFGWLAFPSVYTSVDARPYALALLAIAIAVYGFQRAVMTGSLQARALWVGGGAMVAWAHYVQYPVILGLHVAYVLIPGLRSRYRSRQFIFDAGFQVGLVALALPQVLALWGRRGGLVWSDNLNYFAFLSPVFAFVPGLVIGLVEQRAQREDGQTGRALRRALLLCALFHVAVLEAASLVSTNLLAPRYFMAIVVPVLLSTAIALARARRAELMAGLIGFAAVTAITLASIKGQTGTFSGIGSQDWRGAVTQLSEQLEADGKAVVFFRSGFVEEDLTPIASAPATTRAPLRSPGSPPFSAPVVSLTYRWTTREREGYYERTVRPAISSAPHFFVLAAPFTPDGVPYLDKFEHWVQTNWPGVFATTRKGFGDIDLLEFRRVETAR